MRYKYILGILLVCMAVISAAAIAERDGKLPDKKSWVKVKDNIELKTALPVVPSEVAILRIDNKNLDEKAALDIAEKVLGVKTTKIKSDKDKIALGNKDDEETEITIYKKGQLKYSTGKEWKKIYKKEEVQSEKQAKDIAAGYIKKLADADLINKEISDSPIMEVVDDEIIAYNEKDKTAATFVSNRHVNLYLSHDGIPLSGAGAKVRLYTGKNGEVLGLLNSIGKWIPGKKVQLKTPDEAIEEMKTDGYRDVTIEIMRLVYNVKSPEDNVEDIQPAYDIRGYMHAYNGEGPHFALIVPAVK